MRRIWAGLMAVALGAGTAGAQDHFATGHRVSVVVGSTVSNFDAPAGFGASRRAGPLLGLSYHVAGGGRLAFDPELVVVQKGATLAIDPVANGFDQMRYLEAPLLGRLNLTMGGRARPFLVAGPTVGLRLDCTAGRVLGSTPFSESCTKAGASFGRGEVAGTVGAGIDFGRVQLGGRYELGLSKASSATALKNRMLAFSVGFSVHG